MADKPISSLPPVDNLPNEQPDIESGDLFVLEQNNVAKKVSGEQLTKFISRNVQNYDGVIVGSTAGGGASYNPTTQTLTLELPHGPGIKQVVAPENPHQPGAVDTYTLISDDIRTTDGLTPGTEIGTFQVYNGMNGTGTVNSVAGVSPNATTHDVTKASLLNALAGDLFDMFYPVGSYYISATASVNPGYSEGVFGRGTWTPVTDRFIYGAGAKTVGTRSGSETHTLTQAELPNVNIPVGDVPRSYSGGTALNYQMAMFRTDASGGSKWYLPARDDGSGGEKLVTAPLGSGDPIDIMPPYEVAYIWKRIL